MNKLNQIAVIGAGIAGLSCATLLQNAGLQVTVFEKSRGPSGRLSTRIVKDLQCDHGAQYFTARDAIFKAEVERWLEAGVAKLWQPQLKVFNGHSFTAKEQEKTLRYVGYPKNNAPAHWVAESLDLRTESTVIDISKSAHQWKIKTREHGVLKDTYDAVVLAIPAPQAGSLLLGKSNSAYALSKQVEMQPCFALMVELDVAIAPDFDGLFINHGILSWLANDSIKPGRNRHGKQTWILHTTSDWTTAKVNAEQEHITKLMLNEFQTILQKAMPTFEMDKGIRIRNSTLHRWLYADCKAYLDDVYYFDAELNVGLCGDWLNGGKVQGAWLSGYTLAQDILKARNA
jgi:renalase